MVNYKYMIIGRDSNMKPSKVVSRHTTLKSARDKLLKGKLGLPKSFKGAEIVAVQKR